MLEIGGDLDLGEEAFGADDGAEFGLEDLDGDLAVVLEVVREVDRGHAARAELPPMRSGGASLRSWAR